MRQTQESRPEVLLQFRKWQLIGMS